jgi:hypothetical protein
MRSYQVVANQNGFPSQYNDLRHDARGGSFLLAHQLLGYLALPTAPTNGQTITLTINGNAVVLTAVGSIGSAAGNVLNPGTAAGYAANVLAFLRQPQTTTANAVALSAIDWQLLSYLSFSLVGTTIYISSNNTALYGPLSSLTVTTTVTGASWTAATMQFFVEPGVTYVSGTRVIFAGGPTPAVTAPTSHPRIDVLTIDSSGTLAWTTGTENVSPSAPAYPANKVPLCELFNVVGETTLNDFENQQSGQGYVYNDVRAFLQLPFNPGAIAADLIPDADGTRNLGSLGTEWSTLYVKTGIFVNGLQLGAAKFGGTGADGALTASSGTTTINLANAAVVVKNYTSISLTGTANVAFTNPNANGTLVIIKSQGGVTLTSSATPIIDCSGLGGAGGAAVSTNSGSTLSGNVGSNGYGTLFLTNAGAPGTSGGGGNPGVAISAVQPNVLSQFLQRYAQAFVGAGGGSGDAVSVSSGGSPVVSGAGGNGGGCLIFECAGAWNFTTANGISVAGKNGGNGSGGNISRGPGGGGGGGGGFCLVLYGSLTANSGTITVSGGTGGTNDPSTNGQVPAGGGGGGSTGAGTAGNTSGTPNTQTGGNGAAGASVVALNTEYV